MLKMIQTTLVLLVRVCYSLSTKDEQHSTVTQTNNNYYFGNNITLPPTTTDNNKQTSHLNITDNTGNRNTRLFTSDPPYRPNKEHKYLMQFKGCFEIVKFTQSLWEDGLFTKALGRNTKHECFSWCFYLSFSEYFAISEKICYCFNVTAPVYAMANISYCGAACGTSETCKGTSSYVGIYKVSASKTILYSSPRVRNTSMKMDSTLTLKKDIFIVFNTVMAICIFLLMGVIVILIKREKKLRNKLDKLEATVVEQATSIEVLDDDNNYESIPRSISNPMLYSNDIYNDTEDTSTPFEDVN